MKKNQLFNKNIYLEGLSQTFLIGILLIVLSTILNCMPDLDLYNLLKYTDQNQVYKELYLKDINSMMNYITIIVPFIMAYSQFKFLNNRKACDFYHALPIKRSTLFLNFSLASFTTIVIAMILPVLVQTFISSLNEYNIIDFRFLLPVILDYIIVAFLAFSAILLGLFLTNHPIPATFVALIVLIFPRYTTTQFIQIRNFSSNYFFNGHQKFTDIFGNYNNLFYKKITGVKDFRFFSNVLYLGSDESTRYAQELDYTVFSYVYTTILAIAIFSFACFVFVKRKSEITASATSNKLVNNILRILFVLPSSVQLISNIFVYNTTHDNYAYYMFTGSWNDLTYPLAISIVLIFFIYELVITKNLISMLKVAPMFLIVIAINAGLYYGLDTSISTGMKNSYIDRNDITSVSFNFYDHDYFPYFDSYTKEMLKDYEITDPNIIDLVHSNLNATLYNTPIYSSYNLHLGHTTINTNNTSGAETSSITRFFSYDLESTAKLADLLSNDEYINNNILTILPDKEDVYIARATSFGKNFDIETTKIITDTFYQEYNSLTKEQQLEIMHIAPTSWFEINWLEDYESNPNYSKSMLIEGLQNEFRYDQYGKFEYRERPVFEFDTDLNTTIYQAFPSYNSNDLYPHLALYTIEGLGKYIELNQNFPNTKKLLIDIYLEQNHANSINFVNNTINDIDNNYFFCITGLEDSYAMLSQPTANLKNINSPNKVEYDEEFIAFIKEAVTRVGSQPIDYDNMYIFTFYRNSNNILRILVPLTNEEYDKYLLNITDYVTTTSKGIEIPLDYIGKPVDYNRS